MLGLLYGTVVRARNFAYDRRWKEIYESTLPVISVGNLTVGGNSKTPLAIYLARLLGRLGYSPVVLTRGYGGSAAGPLEVTDGSTSGEVGDEAILIRRRARVPVIIARKRVEGARYIEEKKLGDLIILDDGFQHRALARSLDIVCAFVGSESARKNFKSGRLLPFGRFREPKNAGLARAHVAVLAERKPLEDSVPSTIRNDLDLPGHMCVVRSYLVVDGAYSLADGARKNLKTAFAFCGLANPEAFFESAAAAGITLTGKKGFRDHYRYSLKDIEALKAAAGDAPLLCTEKDAVKLRELGFTDCFELRANLCIEPEADFLEALFKRLQVPEGDESQDAVG